MGTAKRSWKRAMVCGVSPISGTRHRACWPRLDHGLDDAQIDLGLAAPGHALEQEHLESVETGR